MRGHSPQPSRSHCLQIERYGTHRLACTACTTSEPLRHLDEPTAAAATAAGCQARPAGLGAAAHGPQ